MDTRAYNINLRNDYFNPVAVGLSQYDEGVVLAFSVYDGTDPAVFASGTTAQIMGVRPSGVGFDVACTLTDNVVTVSTITDMTGEAGIIPVEIRFYNSGVNVGTCNFIFVIEKAAHPDGTIDADITHEQTFIERLEALETNTVTDPTLSISGRPADAKATGDAIDAVDAQVSDLKEDLKQDQTSFIACESGTYKDADGAVKSSSNTRIRNARPVSVKGYDAIVIPDGYEAWIFRLDKNGAYISSVRSWKSGNVMFSDILTDATRYINFGIKNTATPNSNISGEIETVENGFILIPTIATIKDDIENLKDKAIVYENVTDEYDVAVGQAYGNVGSTINISTSNGYKHVRIPKSDNIDFVNFSTNYNASGVSSYVQYVDDNDTIISRDYINGSFDLGETYKYIPNYPTGATGMYVTGGILSSAFNITLEIYKQADIASIADDVKKKADRDYNEIVKSVCRIADGLDVPHQSIIGYKTAYQNGFRAMLCDLRFTSDNVAVLEHDAYLNGNYSDVYLNGTLVEPNTVAIANTTYSDLLQYDFGYYKGEEYAGTKIMTFEQMLNLCKCLGCEVWIETKVTMTTEQYDIAFGLIRQYGMEQNCVWNPQSVQQLADLIAYEPDVYINVHSNISSGQTLPDDRVNAIISATTDYNKHHNSITLTYGGLITSEQFKSLSEAGVGIMGTTLNTEQQVLDYYNQGVPYTSITSVLSNTIIAGKVLYNNIMG